MEGGCGLLQDVFEKEARKQDMGTPFVVELTSLFQFYHQDLWSFMPSKHDYTMAIKVAKEAIKDVVDKSIPKEMTKSIIYRMIHRSRQPHTEKGEGQSTVILLVKYNICLSWHLIEAQIKKAVSRISFGKDVDIHLEFATGEKPKDTDVAEVLAREFEPALIYLCGPRFYVGIEEPI